MNAKQQIEKRLKDLTSGDLTERTFFEQKFRTYKEHLEKKGNLSAISIRTMLTVVASFFSRNGLTLNLKRGDWQSTLETKVLHRFKLSLDDVKKLYAHANLRDKALMLVLAQSGFSEIDAIALRIEDIKTLYDMPQTAHYFIEKPREKTNIIQATCISYEALHDIRAMLSERQNPEKGFLFVSGTFGKGAQLSTRTINEAMKSLAVRTFGAEKAKQFKTKSLRSFYNSALLRSGTKGEIKDVMMGHKRMGARGHYAYDEYTIKEAYSQAFEHLSINGIQSREDLAEMRNSFKLMQVNLSQTIAELTERNKNLENMLTALGVDIKTLQRTVNQNQKDIIRLEKKTKTKETVDYH
jgi:integrase